MYGQDTQSIQTARLQDACGFPVDPSVGYAFGTILGSTLDESKRREHAARLIRKRAAAKGVTSFYNFTGLHRDYPVQGEAIKWAEEWTGHAFYWDELATLARQHFGGRGNETVGVFNRATGGIVAACMALSKAGSIVLSVTPGSRSHPSISRGVALGQAKLIEVNTLQQAEQHLSQGQVSLVVITGVSSELEVMEEKTLLGVVRAGHDCGLVVFLDDAYGARLRPIIYGQCKSLQTGADVVVTSCDKAGIGGPRAGLMAGKPELMDRVLARGAELGLEARSPLALGVYGSLRQFDPRLLQGEAELGVKLYEELCVHFGQDKVKKPGLGATIPEDAAWSIVQSMRGKQDRLPVVPAEVTAAMGMYWLEHHGIITVNALGQPGSRVSLRFKPDPAEVERFGGISRAIQAIDDGFRYVAERAESITTMRSLILGE